MNTADYLESLDVEFGRVYSSDSAVDHNHLGLGALRVIDGAISDFVNKVCLNNFRLDLPNVVNLSRNNPGEGWDCFKVNNKTFGVRYSDYIKSISHGVRIPADLVSQLSEIASRYKAIPDDVFQYDFCVGVDWNPGDFGESFSSCLWGDYNTGRVAGSESGDLCAVRFYRDGHAMGRCLLWRESGVLIAFNAYHGSMTLEDMARVVCAHFGKSWDFTRVILESDVLYINSDKGLAITEDVGAVDSYYEIWIDGLTRCDCCGNYHNQESLYEVAGGDWVCEYCLSDRYYLCAVCDEYFHDRDTVCLYGDSYCDHCFDNNFSRCNGCHEYFHNDDLTKGLCYSCYEYEGVEA